MEIDLVNWSIIKVAIPVGSTSRDLIFMLYSSHIVYAKEVQIVYSIGCVYWIATYCMYLGLLPSQPAMREVDWLIEIGLNWLDST